MIDAILVLSFTNLKFWKFTKIPFVLPIGTTVYLDYKEGYLPACAVDSYEWLENYPRVIAINLNEDESEKWTLLAPDSRHQLIEYMKSVGWNYEAEKDRYDPIP